MNRITEKMLESLVTRINTKQGTPLAQYTKQNNGVYKANINNYHLDYAYGGVELLQMTNENGGVTTISQGGYVPKRELYNWIMAYLAGMSA